MSNILINNEAELPAPSDAQLQSWAQKVLDQQNRSGAEVSLTICEAEEIQNLNHEYRGKDKATNVLSFPADIPAEFALDLLGDIIICPEIVENEAAEYDINLEQRWAHMVCHGVLHLLGYDHIDPTEAEEMEQLETQLLVSWGYTSPYTLTNEQEK